MPLISFRDQLAYNNYNVKLHFNDSYFNKKDKIHEKLLECDILGINSKSIHFLWNHNREYLFEFLIKAKGKGRKIIWFDTYDSTASTEFEVLPFVDLYIKNQLLKNKKLYLEERYNKRYFINQLNDLYCIKQEANYNFPTPDLNSLSKIHLGWNSSYENYNKNRYNIFSKVNHKFLRPNKLWPQKFHNKFYPVDAKRNNLCSYRGTTNYKWTAIKRHREEVGRILTYIGVESKKINLDLFFHEMQSSLISVGPFGLGEITLRDYEIIISGCLLIKPNLSFMKTWPNLFIEGETYIPIKWDLSDLLAKIELLRVESEYRAQIAKKAQKIYKKYINEENSPQIFVNNFKSIIDKLTY